MLPKTIGVKIVLCGMSAARPLFAQEQTLAATHRMSVSCHERPLTGCGRPAEDRTCGTDQFVMLIEPAHVVRASALQIGRGAHRRYVVSLIAATNSEIRRNMP